MAGSTSELSERVARNQDRFRKINEEIATTNAAHAWFESSMPAWVCECTNEHCLEAVNLAVAEYEAVRADGTHFLVAPSAEHVVAATAFIGPSLRRLCEGAPTRRPAVQTQRLVSVSRPSRLRSDARSARLGPGHAKPSSDEARPERRRVAHSPARGTSSQRRSVSPREGSRPGVRYRCSRGSCSSRRTGS
jgi:hypothetical protein